MNSDFHTLVGQGSLFSDAGCIDAIFSGLNGSTAGARTLQVLTFLTSEYCCRLCRLVTGIGAQAAHRVLQDDGLLISVTNTSHDTRRVEFKGSGSTQWHPDTFVITAPDSGMAIRVWVLRKARPDKID